MIDYNVEYFFELLNVAVHNDPVQQPRDNIDWIQIEALMLKNRVMPIILPKVRELPEEFLPEKTLLEKWKCISFKMEMEQMISCQELRKVIKQADEKGIQMIPFKGAFLASLYPGSFKRKSCDFDIYVLREQEKDVYKMLTDMGYTYCEQKKNVCVFMIEGKIKIEIHFSIYEDYLGEKIDLLNNMNLLNPNKYVEFDLFGVRSKTLGYEEHLIYQFFHIIKHFSFEKISIKYLLDIALYVDAFWEKIDWESFWGKMRQLQYEKFAEITFAICEKYFGMCADVQKSINVSTEIMNIFTEEILKDTEECRVSWENIRMIEPYLYQGVQVKSKSSFLIRIRMLFPTIDSLPMRYTYAKKNKLLLPIAWIERMIRHVYWAYIKKDSEDTAYKINDVTERIILLSELGLLKQDN